jgi:hypothetical protein
MAETADLKSLAQRVIARDTSRDTLSHPPGTDSVPAGQSEKEKFTVPLPYRGALSALREGPPAHVERGRWHVATSDADRFLETWGEQAAALGWTVTDLFGLAPVPDQPAPFWGRLSRYDQTGLVWLLRGRPVIAITSTTAAIQRSPLGVTVYRRCIVQKVSPL